MTAATVADILDTPGRRDANSSVVEGGGEYQEREYPRCIRPGRFEIGYLKYSPRYPGHGWHERHWTVISAHW
jgi:hypothetical protein